MDLDHGISPSASPQVPPPDLLTSSVHTLGSCARLDEQLPAGTVGCRSQSKLDPSSQGTVSAKLRVRLEVRVKAPKPCAARAALTVRVTLAPQTSMQPCPASAATSPGGHPGMQSPPRLSTDEGQRRQSSGQQQQQPGWPQQEQQGPAAVTQPPQAQQMQQQTAAPTWPQAQVHSPLH